MSDLRRVESVGESKSILLPLGDHDLVDGSLGMLVLFFNYRVPELVLVSRHLELGVIGRQC